MRPRRLSLWPPLPPEVHTRVPRDLPFPLAEPHCRLYARARHGLCAGARALGLGPGDEVLMPAYHSGSEVEALLKAGLGCAFYDLDERLEPDERELESLVGATTRALHLIHFLGFPQDAARWKAWCEDRGLLLIEDAAQAWLASAGDRPVGSAADLAVFCLYKTFGVPDGAAALSRAFEGHHAGWTAQIGVDERPARGTRRLIRREAAWLAGRSGLIASALPEFDDAVTYGSEGEVGLGEALPPSRATLALLRRVYDPTAGARRRANYRMLIEELGDRVPGPLRELPEGAVPFAFPVETDRKAELLGRLAAARIHAGNLWLLPHPALPADRYPRSARLRETVVALPVHQELRTADLERIASVVQPRRTRPRPQLELLPSLEAGRQAWSELAERSGNVFATWEWCSRWWRHLGQGELEPVLVRRPGSAEPAALLPLYAYDSQPTALPLRLRMLRFLGHDAGHGLGPICAPRDAPLAASALRRWLAEHKGWDLLIGDDMPGEPDWSAFLDASVLERESSPLLRARDAGWAGFLASRSRHFRHRVAAAEKKLARDHRVSYRLATDPARLPADFDLLVSLHAARWPEDPVFDGAAGAFQRDFAACALERGWLRLRFLELDGQPVASIYGLRFGDVESIYIAGRDPTLSGTGWALFTHAIRLALDDGVRECRLLRGGQQYKYRVANRDVGVATLALSGSAAGRVALAAELASRRSGRTRAAARAARRVLGPRAASAVSEPASDG